MSPFLNRVLKWCRSSGFHERPEKGIRSSPTYETSSLSSSQERDRKTSYTPDDVSLDYVSTCSTFAEYVERTKQEEKAGRKRRRRERRREEWKKWTYEPDAYIVIF
ncbi:hypothetical protein KEM54_000019 [Ascosphaera aggregata]|nr:hypothetical protein KEM54_000019 [Ascosphaera aggregata]